MGSKSGIQTISESVKILALSLVAILCVCPFSGQINDAQITGKWIYAGMAFFSMVIIVLIIDAFACTDVGVNSDCTITFAIPFMLSGLVVTIHALLQITGLVTARNANGYNVLAGFDNPAGVASALTVSLPFVLVLVELLSCVVPLCDPMDSRLLLKTLNSLTWDTWLSLTVIS